MKRFKLAALAGIAGAVTACVTVNLNFNFPEKELQNKLFEQEKAVREEAPAEKKQNAAAFDPELMFLAGPAAPQDDKINIHVSTPVIEKINSDRKARWPRLKDYYAKGWVGDGNDGLVHERDAHNLAGKEKAEFNGAIKSENGDREKILKEIVKANRLEEAAQPKVRAVWSRAQKQASEEGWWIETKAGGWKKKTSDDHKTLSEGKEVEK